MRVIYRPSRGVLGSWEHTSACCFCSCPSALPSNRSGCRDNGLLLAPRNDPARSPLTGLLEVPALHLGQGALRDSARLPPAPTERFPSPPWCSRGAPRPSGAAVSTSALCGACAADTGPFHQRAQVPNAGVTLPAACTHVCALQTRLSGKYPAMSRATWRHLWLGLSWTALGRVCRTLKNERHLSNNYYDPDTNLHVCLTHMFSHLKVRTPRRRMSAKKDSLGRTRPRFVIRVQQPSLCSSQNSTG